MSLTFEEVDAPIKQTIGDAVAKRIEYMWDSKPIILTGRYVLRNRKMSDVFESVSDVQLQVEIVCTNDLPSGYNQDDVAVAAKTWVPFKTLGVIRDIKE